MTINLLQVTPYLGFKIWRKYIHVAMTTASLLPTILKTKHDATENMANLWFVNRHEIVRDCLVKNKSTTKPVKFAENTLLLEMYLF